MHSFTVVIKAEKKFLMFMMSIFGISAVNGTGLSIFS
ncbi:RAxF-45 family protein [Rossellomorea sp. NS-SX7]